MERVVLITGVAGGIGMATARLFADSGWHVIGVDSLATEAPGGVDLYIQADVSEQETVEQLFVRISKEIGHLNTLVNNAAIQICAPLIEMQVCDWDLIMASNVRSVFLTAKFAYPLICKQGGSIVNISSVHALATSNNIAAYAASKGAMLALTRAMALEFARDKIRVNAIMPGAVDTPMLHSGLVRWNDQQCDTNILIEALGNRTVLGRVANPYEIAQAILFLSDDERSSFITGQALVVDGGATARLSTE